MELIPDVKQAISAMSDIDLLKLKYSEAFQYFVSFYISFVRELGEADILEFKSQITKEYFNQQEVYHIKVRELVNDQSKAGMLHGSLLYAVKGRAKKESTAFEERKICFGMETYRWLFLISEVLERFTGRYESFLRTSLETTCRPVMVQENRKMIKIVFLAANPVDTSRIRFDKEARTSDERLRLAECRALFDLKPQLAARTADIQQYVLRYKPQIVHFSGHGSASGEIVLEDVSGGSRPVTVKAVEQLFCTLKRSVDIRCVVLSARYSARQARAISQHIECVVGISKAIRGEAAISFAADFYRPLGYGMSIREAFDLGCAQVGMDYLGEEEQPKLLVRPDIDPSKIIFVPR
ncbi:MAG: hypothetical protein DDT32_00915 [Syntrophomonadaceae bacterium]|nr:hypothetical protein [Bacillota bacterium]